MPYDPNRTLLEQSFFSGGDATPDKLRSLVQAIRLKANEHDALAFLSGCASNFLLEFARNLEDEERSYDAIKVGKTDERT